MSIMGDVIGDLNARRGQIQGIRRPCLAASESTPFVPLAADVRLRHRPALQDPGPRQYSMEPSHYIELPKSLQEQLIGRRNQLHQEQCSSNSIPIGTMIPLNKV